MRMISEKKSKQIFDKVYILNSSVILKDLIEELNKNTCSETLVLCLSSHNYLQHEKQKLISGTHCNIFFKSFYELLSEEDMSFCDIEADRLLRHQQSERSFLHIEQYYKLIGIQKNKVLMKKLLDHCTVKSGYIMSDGLGIHAPTWEKGGFEIISDLDSSSVKSSNLINELISKINSLINFLSLSVFYVSIENQSNLFIGNKNRLSQYLSEDIEFHKPAGYKIFLLRMCFLVIYISQKSIIFKPLQHALLVLMKVTFLKRISRIYTSIHEYSYEISLLGKKLQKEIFVFQDGLLPGNYESRYLRYFNNVSKFLVWDDFSGRIFKKHSLEYQIFYGYKKTPLPKILSKKKIKNIVFLASGSGDWTALKNRSDEDLIFEALYETSIEVPSINFTFRPHPLWERPEHQGIGSISRLEEFTSIQERSNFFISSNISKDIQSKTLSHLSSTIENDILDADLVLADHSQSLFSAARSRKFIASISLSNKRSFFQDYIDLGIPFINSKDNLLKLIDNIDNSDEFLIRYNRAIKNFNKVHITNKHQIE